MAISDRIDSIITHLENAYTKISSKGGTLPANKNMANLEDAIDSISVGSQVRLNAPTLSFGTFTTQDNPLIITNSYNGNFVKTYDVYSENTLLTSINAYTTSNTIDLLDYISEPGTYTIKVVAKGTNFLDSLAATITYKTAVYITNNLTHCTTNNTTTSILIGNSYSATLTEEQGYSFVGASVSIYMDGVDITSSAYDGKRTISINSVTGTLVITASFATITQLATPTISLVGNTLSITPVSNAELYVLCLSGNEWQELNITTIDLSQLLTITGTYTVSVMTRADGYLDSAQSTTVSYVNSSGDVPSAILNDNSWSTIRLVCEAGNASNYWSVGDTKVDLGLDNVTRTFRIVDMQGLYNKHVVFEQVELEPASRMMKGVDENEACYPNSFLRNTTLPQLLTNFSENLQLSVAKTKYGTVLRQPSGQGGFVDSFVEIEDKLFIPAGREYFASISFNYREDSHLTTYEYYENMANPSPDRAKEFNGVASRYWTRTSDWLMSYNFYMITEASSTPGSYGTGSISYGSSLCYAPCFAF